MKELKNVVEDCMRYIEGCKQIGNEETVVEYIIEYEDFHGEYMDEELKKELLFVFDIRTLIDTIVPDDESRFDGEVSCPGFLYEAVLEEPNLETVKDFISDFCAGADCVAEECVFYKGIKDWYEARK